MKVVAIVQARMNSTRLPGKVMLPLVGDKPVLDVVVSRVAAAKSISQVVVATSLNTADSAISNWCARNRVACYKGSEADVLGRVYGAAKMFRADVVVDITADCPLVDPGHIDRLITEFTGANESYKPTAVNNCALDYVSNCWERQWPDGLDVQVYSMLALDRVAHCEDSVREHVGWNVHRLAERFDFHLRQVSPPPKYRRPELGLTLDEFQDYELLKKLFVEMYLAHGTVLFPAEAALDYLLARPELMAINADVKRKVPGEGDKK